MITTRRLNTVYRHISHSSTLPSRSSSSSASPAQFARMNSSLNIQTKYKLNSGYEIPVLGFGTGLNPSLLHVTPGDSLPSFGYFVNADTQVLSYGQVYQTPADITERVSQKAFEVGYRHVDSAKAYKNEEPCGQAIRNSGLKRSEIFFTTKVPAREMGYDKAKAAIEASLKNADVEYIDLLLIHAPYGGKEARQGSWRAVVEAQRGGKVRSIGISNYGVHHLDELEEYIKSGIGGTIDVGQYELHPWLPRRDIVDWLQKRGVVVEAYSPLVRSQRMDDPTLVNLGKKYGKTPAQILVRWSLQKGFVPLPKSTHEERIEENAQVFDFQLSAEDMESLNTNDYSPCTWDPTVSND